MKDFDMTNFGMAPIKREGGVVDPDSLTWECDLGTCEKCHNKYQNWKKMFDEEQAAFKERNT